MKIYGIKNCSTVKKALTWLEQHQVAYEFHDFKKLGISDNKLREWIAQVGLDNLINKRGTTWKKVDPSVQQAAIANTLLAIKLMQEQTSIIKRPILETTKGIVLGFDEIVYARIKGEKSM